MSAIPPFAIPRLTAAEKNERMIETAIKIVVRIAGVPLRRSNNNWGRTPALAQPSFKACWASGRVAKAIS